MHVTMGGPIRLDEPRRRASRCCHACARSGWGAEPLDGPGQTLDEADAGLPAECPPGLRDVGLVDVRVVDGPGNVDDVAVAADQASDRLGDVEHRGLVRVTDVYRPGEVAPQ